MRSRYFLWVWIWTVWFRQIPLRGMLPRRSPWRPLLALSGVPGFPNGVRRRIERRVLATHAPGRPAG